MRDGNRVGTGSAEMIQFDSGGWGWGRCDVMTSDLEQEAADSPPPPASVHSSPPGPLKATFKC